MEDAVKAMAACKDARLDTQEQPLHICFSTARFAPDPAALQQQGWLAPEAAAEMALAYAGWQPKEFGGEGGGTTAGAAAAAEGALDDDPLAAWERQQAEGEEAAEEGQIVGAAAEQAQQQAQQQVQQDPAAALEQQRVAAEAAGFAYDPGTGYMLEPTSGYYYDANTGTVLRAWVGYPLPAFVCQCLEQGSSVTAGVHTTLSLSAFACTLCLPIHARLRVDAAAVA